MLPSPEVTEITLYAEWAEASMPTTITIVVPETTPDEYKSTTYNVYKDGV